MGTMVGRCSVCKKKRRFDNSKAARVCKLCVPPGVDQVDLKLRNKPRYRGEMLYSLVLTTVDQGLVNAWARLRTFDFASPPTTGHEIDIRLLREYLAQHYYKGYERGDDWLEELRWRKLRADDPDVISAITDAINARKDSSR